MWRCIHELAGAIGIHPGPLTLRELLWMAEAHSRDRWQHTASLLAMIANVHRDTRRHKALKPADFNPHEQRHSTVTDTQEAFALMKQAFVPPPKEPTP